MGIAIDSNETSKSTRTLLTCGIVAAILFPVVAAIQAFTRPGFDINLHPLSLLSLGGLGWIQVANFIVSGILFLAFAVGLRRVLRGSPGGTWGPGLIGAYGACLVAAGIFTPDPMDGFPPGTPAGLPASLSWHAIVHNLLFFALFLLLLGAQFVLARHFGSEGKRDWAAYTVVSALAAPVLIVIAYGTAALFGSILFVMSLVGDVWLVLVAWRLRGEVKRRQD